MLATLIQDGVSMPLRAYEKDSEPEVMSSSAIYSHCSPWREASLMEVFGHGHCVLY